MSIFFPTSMVMESGSTQSTLVAVAVAVADVDVDGVGSSCLVLDLVSKKQVWISIVDQRLSHDSVR